MSMTSAPKPLPAHLLLHVALWIEDAHTFVSFLEALEDDLGPLEPFWQLHRQVQDSTSWWPKLQLTTIVASTLPHIEAIAKHYTYVVNRSGDYDVEWVQRHVPGTAKLSWNWFPDLAFARLSISIDEWYAQWASLSNEMTHIEWRGRYYQEPTHLVPLLPRFQNLIQLTLFGMLGAALCDPIFTWLAASTVTDLRLGCFARATFVSASMLNHMKRWIKTQPVRTFSVHRWAFGGTVSDALKIEFFQVEFHCPSLEEELAWHDDCGFDSLQIPLEKIPARRLIFHDANLSSTMMLNLAAGLVDSQVEKLEMHGQVLDKCNWPGRRADLWRKLGSKFSPTPLRSLNLENCNLCDAEMIFVAKGLQECNALETLYLAGNKLDIDSALATLVFSPPTLRRVNFGKTEMELDSLDLLRSFALHRQIVELTVASTLEGTPDIGGHDIWVVIPVLFIRTKMILFRIPPCFMILYPVFQNTSQIRFFPKISILHVPLQLPISSSVETMWATRCFLALSSAAYLTLSADVTEIDVLPLMPLKLYQLPRMRWTDLSRLLGFQTSGKMLVDKPMETMLGKLNVPKEDAAAFAKLSSDEVKSLYGDDEFLPEKDVWVAMDLIQEHDFPAAIELLEHVKGSVERRFGTKHPLYANALADLGYAYMEQKDYIKSNALLVEAMYLDEQLQETYGVYNTAASVNLMATSALRSGLGNFEALSAAYESAFDALHKESNSAQFEILMNLANMYRLHWLPLRAINMFKLARQFVPANPSAQYADLLLGLGVSYLMEGEFHQAHDVLTKSLDMYTLVRDQPTLAAGSKASEWEASYFLATAQMRLHKHATALTQLQSLRKKQLPPLPAFPDAHAVLMTSIGHCLGEMGYTDQAIGMLEAAKSLLVAHERDAVNPLFVPYIHLKIDHWLAMLWQTDEAKHEAAYNRVTSLFGDQHALALLHKSTAI
ncbi:Aste57867_13253 [Aphanomyces stellatus]|uniref:Aste57867_13253 protein n=1 Tax=Aphanomyces stellatus TaxID=120398 RepID=A0A485KYI7_9STRA|nr:hypothetical protein As57867_013204 [Aphanomyces stellatus]VFT90093.1 Aste57867_13253 [Aphanomyces stellatus]